MYSSKREYKNAFYINFTFVVFHYTVLIMVGIHCVASRMVAHLDAQLGMYVMMHCIMSTECCFNFNVGKGNPELLSLVGM